MIAFLANDFSNSGDHTAATSNIISCRAYFAAHIEIEVVIKLLITGARGMLGSSIARLAASKPEIELVLWDRSTVDLMDTPRVNELLGATKPDAIIHAAAKVGGIHANIAHPVEFLAQNQVMDNNVLMGALSHSIPNFVYVGSSCMYPRDYRQPLVESDIMAAPLEPTNEGYALAKISGSRLASYISREHGLNYKTIIPSNLYGPGDNFDSKSSHLVAACIAKVHAAKMSDANTIDVWGDGLARREFTYVDDLSEWIIKALPDISRWPDLMNLGLGRDYSVNDFYAAAMEAVDYRVELVHDLSKPTGMHQKLMDSSLAIQTCGWAPSTDIQVGMKNTYLNFLERGI
jgi:GDP-L-fucose synthase